MRGAKRSEKKISSGENDIAKVLKQRQTWQVQRTEENAERLECRV